MLNLPNLVSYWPLLVLVVAILIFDLVLVVIFRKFGEAERQQLEFNQKKEDALAPAFRQAEEMLLAAREKAQKAVEVSVAQADRVTATARDEADQITKKAQADAVEIVAKAQKEATDLVDLVKVNQAEMQKRFSAKIDEAASLSAGEFAKVTGELAESWKGQLQKISDDDIKTIRSVSDTIEKAAIGEMEEFKKSLANRTSELEESVEQKVTEAYGAMLERVKESENARLGKLDQKVIDILQLVAKSALGKTLPFSEHEKLIFEALDKAKKDKIL